MKYSTVIAIGLFFLVFQSIFLCVVCASEGKTYFYEDFETRYDGWKRTDGIVLLRRTQRLISFEGKCAFKMTGIVNNGFSGRFEHAVNIPVIPNIIFEFAYLFYSKHVSYIGYQINFSDKKQGNYFSLIDDDYYVNITNVYVVQYKKEPIGYWNFHQVRLYEDYKRAFGSVPPNLRITSVSMIIGDPYYKQRFQTAYFDSIKIYEDITNYPPDAPLRPSGPERGKINTLYQYSISTTDVNNDRVRIYCEYENNTGLWSEWVGSGDSATFDLKWMSPGNYRVRAYAQDNSGKNSSWSEPLTVYIFNDTNPLRILNPNGNEQLYLGMNHTITWLSNESIGDKVKIELYQNKIPTIVIEESTENDGRYIWEIPQNLTPGTDYKIKISSVDQPSLFFDFSNSSFILKNVIALDVSIDSTDINSMDWTPKVNDTVHLIAKITCKGTQSLNTTINFYIKNLNQSSFEKTLINTTLQRLVQPETICQILWQPTQVGDYQLSVEIIINNETEELSTLNNVANASRNLCVGATDDDLLFISPKEISRIRDGHTMQINLTVICYNHYLNNVNLRILEPNDFKVTISTPPQNLVPNIPQEYIIVVTPPDISNNISSIQKEIMIEAVGYFSDGTEWISNYGYVVIEIYKPESLVTEVAVLTLLVGGLITFVSMIVVESGKYKLFSLFSFVIPLFTRIRSEEVLENTVRGQIYGYIKTNPGVHYNNIKKSLDVGNGTLAHHLSMLEKTGLIKSRQEGLRYRLFYPIEMKFPEVRKYMLSEFQIMLLKIIEEKPGITQKEIVRMQEESQQTVSYNLKELEKVREILSLKKNGKKLYYLVPNKQTNIA
ncbi:MAG: winged helix-turn-helix transcriptional regulator [Candidatus Thermoplasmatota archaeon]|nr:winged helix-turn-helix transcriptional regulator [Candidatus Thermoplasmatota archaeon]